MAALENAATLPYCHSLSTNCPDCSSGCSASAATQAVLPGNSACTPPPSSALGAGITTPVDGAPPTSPTVHSASSQVRSSFIDNNEVRAITANSPVTVVYSSNVGPCGIRDSLQHMMPLFEGTPGVVFIQDAKLSALSVRAFKAAAHRMLPEYAVFTRTSLKGKHDQIRVVTFVHLALAARGTQIDIHKMPSPNTACSIEDLASRVQIIKTVDIHTDECILWVNVYQFQAVQQVEQSALLALLGGVLEEWGPKVHHIVCGGDFNASLTARVGYSMDSLTAVADSNLSDWLESGAGSRLVVKEPNAPTWLSPGEDKQAVLDRFLTINAGPAQCRVSCSSHIVHDHKVISITLDSGVVSPLPPKWNVIRPKRLKMDRWLSRRKEWASLVEKRISALTCCHQMEKAEQAQKIALQAAEQVLGMSGGKQASLIPFHSQDFKRLVQAMRVVKATRTDLLKRKTLGPCAPSKAMKMAWDQGVFPEVRVPYSAISDVYSAANVEWTKTWLIILRERSQQLGADIRTLRRGEIRVAFQQCSEAKVARLATGGSGEIQRMLGRKGPPVYAPYVTTDYPDQVTVTVSGQNPTPVLLLQAAVASAVPSAQLKLEAENEGGFHSLQVTGVAPSQLSDVLELAEGHQMLLTNTKLQHVHSSSDRLTAWENHLTREAVATRARCNVCNNSDTVPIPATLPVRVIRHFCKHCCCFVNLVVDPADYASLPFYTDHFPKVSADAGESLAGEISLDDLRFRISKLARGKAPGDDGILYEFLKDGPDNLLLAVLDAVNALLTKKAAMPSDWKGGLIKLLYKKGDPFLCKNYRPVVLLRACYKLYTSILTDRLYGIAERHKLLHPSQEGFRHNRSCGRQAQSLFWAYQNAKRQQQGLVVAFLDFANAFNSVDHQALWKWLRVLGVPDVDMLEEIYSNSFYQADTLHGTSAKIFLTRGTKQGDGLSPLLFSLLFNLLLLGLDATGVGHKSNTGLSTPARAFADDVALTTSTVKDMTKLLAVVDQFCAWSGMRLNTPKSEISAWDFKSGSEPDVSKSTVNGQTLARLPPTQAFRYLGFRFSLMGKWNEEVTHIMTTTKELLQVVAKHVYTVGQMTAVIHSVATARFRYSAAMVPWTDKELDRLHNLWIRLQKGAWRLPPSFPGAVFSFSEDQGGMPVPHPKVFQLQALKQHIEQLALWDDDILACARSQYRQLCQTFGCHTQTELTSALLEAQPTYTCPMARLLRLSGELGLQTRLPAYIVGEPAPQLSWFGLKQRLHKAMLEDSSCPAEALLHGNNALKFWGQAVASTKVSNPTELQWRVIGDRAEWIIPPFRNKAIHRNFSEAVKRWGAPRQVDLKKQLLGSLNARVGMACPGQPGQVHACPPFGEKPPVLNSQLVAIILDDVTSKIEHTDKHHISTTQALSRVDVKAGQQLLHCCTIPQARLGFLRELVPDCLDRLPRWAQLAERTERNRGSLSGQTYHYLQAATGTNLLIGESPLTTSTAFVSCWTDTIDRDGWTGSSPQTSPLLNLPCMPENEQSTSLTWLEEHSNMTWYILTRAKSCSSPVLKRLNRIGLVVCCLSKGMHLHPRAGNWRNGGLQTAKSLETWSLWVKRTTSQEEKRLITQRVKDMPLSKGGHIPFGSNWHSMQEAKHGQAGPYYKLPGLVVATDGSVRADGRMGCAAIFLDDTCSDLMQSVSGEPSSTTAELSALLIAVNSCPLDKQLTMLTDSLTSLQNLISMRRSDFCRDLRLHPQRQLLTDLVAALNTRAGAGTLTSLVKIRAHKGEPLNEAADEAANKAVESDTRTHCTLDNAHCNFSLSDGSAAPWGPRLRTALTEALACKYVQKLRRTKATLDGTTHFNGRPPVHFMNRNQSLLSREECGRHLLGRSLVILGKSAATRRVLMTLGDMIPVQSKLHQWGLSNSSICRLCKGHRESLCHAQCQCPSLALARIKAHHHGWMTVFNHIDTNAGSDWSFFSEMTAEALTALKPPPDLRDRSAEWARLRAGLKDTDLMAEDDTETAIREFSELACSIRTQSGNVQLLRQLLEHSHSRELLGPSNYEDPEWLTTTVKDPTALIEQIEVEIEQLGVHLKSCSLGRKRPDGVALNWQRRTVHLLEYTRCFDSEVTALISADEFKERKYTPLLNLLLDKLGEGWTGKILTFSIGIRGSLRTEVWTNHLLSLGIMANKTQPIMQASVTAVLEALDIIYLARTAALSALSHGRL